MQEYPQPEQQSNRDSSTWLRFDGDHQVLGDPDTPEQFRAAYECLTTLTAHLIVDAGPWCRVLPEHIRAEYQHFLEWSGAFEDPTSDGVGVWFSLSHLHALSYRRLVAAQIADEEQWVEQPILEHFHCQIAQAAAEEADLERLTAELRQRFLENQE